MSTATNSPSGAFTTKQPSIIYILGAPGAGKGTLCSYLTQHYANVYHLSIGDHLRSLLALQTAEASQQLLGGLSQQDFAARMQRRELLPASTIVAITRAAIDSIVTQASAAGHQDSIILLDGFPRSIESARLADAVFGLPSWVFLFYCPRELAADRFLRRRRSTDDDMGVFGKRFEEFERVNGEILRLYSGRVVVFDTTKAFENTREEMEETLYGYLMQLGAVKVKDGIDG